MSYPLDQFPTLNLPAPTVAVNQLTCEERALAVCALRQYIAVYKGFVSEVRKDPETLKSIAEMESAIQKLMQPEGSW